MSDEKVLIDSLVKNGIKGKNIVLFLKLREEAEKLGFTFNEYDEMDGEFIVSFSIES